jgi:DNA-directed RNA polymerase specialized sigma24 family protein
MPCPEPPPPPPCTKRGVDWSSQDAHAAARCLYEDVGRWVRVAYRITRNLDLAEDAVHAAIMVVRTDHLVRRAYGLLHSVPPTAPNLVQALELSALDEGFRRVLAGLDEPGQGYVHRRLVETAQVRLEIAPITNENLVQVRVLLTRARDFERVVGSLAPQEQEQVRQLTRGGRVAREVQINLLGRCVNGLLERPAAALDDDEWHALLGRLVDELLGQRDPEGGFDPTRQEHQVPCKLRPWFRTILANEAHRLRSQQQPPPANGGPGGLAGPGAPADVRGKGTPGAPGDPPLDDDTAFLDQIRGMANLLQVLDTLIPSQRRHLELILKHGLDYGAGVTIARELGKKPGAQRVAWLRLKKRIREILAAMGLEAET